MQLNLILTSLILPLLTLGAPVSPQIHPNSSTPTLSARAAPASTVYKTIQKIEYGPPKVVTKVQIGAVGFPRPPTGYTPVCSSGTFRAVTICAGTEFDDRKSKRQCRFHVPKSQHECETIDGDANSFTFVPERNAGCVLFDGLVCAKDKIRAGAIKCPGAGVSKLWKEGEHMSYKCFGDSAAPEYKQWLVDNGGAADW